jgi:23S rRNA (cytidine1920-2'-O)/16S rRNA (cytidine1409-2'-O)-methyltransferase
MKYRLDQLVAQKGLVSSRSQAESYIKMGLVRVNGTILTKPGTMVSNEAEVKLLVKEQYVSRAGHKLASVAGALKLNFKHKIVLDVGSSTGGFTEFALKKGAKKVYAVDVGTNQLHPSLLGNPQIELHEKTDIRDFTPGETPDIIVMDVSFISSRMILPHLARISDKNTQLAIMIKPQFEAGKHQVNKGIIKNDSIRRQILQDFEAWAKSTFVIVDKADSEVAGSKGNRERFYLLKLSK